MSCGLVICSACKREVHQDGEFDGPSRGWRHCVDKTARCEGATSKYPESTAEIAGRFCGADDYPERHHVGGERFVARADTAPDPQAARAARARLDKVFGKRRKRR